MFRLPLETQRQGAAVKEAQERHKADATDGSTRIVSEEDWDWKCRRETAQEFIYFHPFIQEFLFPNKLRPVETLYRTDIQAARVKLQNGGAYEFKVGRLLLHLFPADLAILSLEISTDSAIHTASEIPLSQIMLLMDQFRRVAAPYWSDTSGDGMAVIAQKVPEQVEWLDVSGKVICAGTFNDWRAHVQDVETGRRLPVAAHWLALIHPLTPYRPDREKIDGLYFEQIDDERIPLLSYISARNAGSISDGDFARLLFCDEPGDSRKYAYGKTFMQDVMKAHSYDRYWEPDEGLTTRYLFSAFSGVVVGSSTDDFFNNILREHFRHHYYHLFLIAHAQKASLLVYWRRLAELMHQYAEDPPSTASRRKFENGIKCLTEDFADFTSRFWFSEVSNQLQPLEMFRLISDKLGTPQLYAQVIEQIRLVRDVESSGLQESWGRLQDYLVPIIIASSILGIEVGFPAIAESVLGKDVSWESSLIFGLSVLVVFTALIAYGIRRLIRR